jgi:hypothetical protein
MKYSKELSKTLETLPSDLKIASLSYKEWKKYCKCSSSVYNVSLAMERIADECTRIDKVFIRLYSRSISQEKTQNIRNFCRITSPSTNVVTLEHVLQFAEINAQTVYKICKRIQKSHKEIIPSSLSSPSGPSDPNTITWLTTARSLHKYEFLGGGKTTHLKYLIKSNIQECPICLEDINKEKDMLIMGCGHVCCLQCAIHHAGMANRSGVWFNLLANAKQHKCPLCRYDKALIRNMLLL